MKEEIASYCRLKAREHDADAYLAGLFAPSAVRQDLWTLQAFAGEVARVPALVGEPMLGEIRLQWWREAMERLFAGRIEPHPLAEALAEAQGRRRFPADPFMRLIEAQERMLHPGGIADEPALRRLTAAIGGDLLRLQIQVLTDGRDDEFVTLIETAGYALGLAQILRQLPAQAARQRIALSTELLARAPALATTGLAAIATARSAFRELRNPQLLPAVLKLTVTAPRLRAIAQGQVDVLKPATESPLFRRQVSMLSAALRGRP